MSSQHWNNVILLIKKSYNTDSSECENAHHNIIKPTLMHSVALNQRGFQWDSMQPKAPKNILTYKLSVLDIIVVKYSTA
jgi:hypothetical protein